VVALAKERLRLEGLARSEPELQPGGAYDGRPADLALKRFLFYECGRCAKPYYGGERNCGAQQEQQQQQRGGQGQQQQQQQQQGGQGQAREFDRAELLCGECNAALSGADCRVHGRQFIEWKCRYCCSLAVWNCFGGTRMCDRWVWWWVRRCLAGGPANGQEQPAGRVVGCCAKQRARPATCFHGCATGGCSICRVLTAGGACRPLPRRCHATPSVRHQPRRCTPASCSLKVEHPQPGEEFCLGCGMCRRS
jgi:hypothetical protein